MARTGIDWGSKDAAYAEDYASGMNSLDPLTNIIISKPNILFTQWLFFHHFVLYIWSAIY